MAVNRDKLNASASKHVRKGNWDKAIRDYQKIVDDDASDVRTMLKIADLRVKLGEFDEALNGYQQVAYIYAQDDIYDKAVAVYKQALRIAPENPRLHRDLGEAYYRHGRLKDAIRAFHQAQKHFRAENDGISQRDVLERMVAIDPDDVGLHVQLAERYEKDGMRAEALTLFQDSSEKLFDEGRLAEFVQVAERIVFLVPTEYKMRKRIVRIYCDRQDSKHALKHLQLLFKERPDDVETLQLLGQTFAKLGTTDKAILVYGELAKAFRKTGEEERALDTFRKILKLDPNHKDARAAIGVSEKHNAPKPAPKPEPKTDALDGVEFLDDDDGIEFLDDDDDDIEFLDEDDDVEFLDDDDLEMEDDAGDDLFAFAAESIGDLGSEVLERLDENPATSLSKAAEESALEVLSPAEIRQILNETEVFLKYGLLDRAEEVLNRVVASAPHNLNAREQMHTYYVKRENRALAANELYELASLTRGTPDRATKYLRRALDFASPAIVGLKAMELGLSLEDDHKTHLEDLNPNFIDEVSEGIDSASESIQHMNRASSIEFLTPDEEEEPTSAEIDIEIDDLALDLDGLGDEKTDANANSDEDELLFLDDVEEGDTGAIPTLDELDELGGIDELGDIDKLGDIDVGEFDMGGLEELEIDGAVHEDVSFSEADLSVFDDKPADDDFNFDISADDADMMFDELFGGGELFDAPEPPPKKKGGDLSEIDFYLEQGLPSEAEDALERFTDEHPTHDGIALRASRLSNMKQAGEQHNAFGARSLSMKFAPEFSVAEETAAELMMMNSNIAMGKTYQEMGHFPEAIDAYRQALDDPEVSPHALLYIALCEIERNDIAAAEDILTTLSSDRAAPGSVRERAVARLHQLRRERA